MEPDFRGVCPNCARDGVTMRLEKSVSEYQVGTGRKVFGTVYRCKRCYYVVRYRTDDEEIKVYDKLSEQESTVVVNEPWVDTYMEQHKEWIRNEQKRKWEGIEIRKRTEEKEKELERIKGIIEKKRNAIDPLNTKRTVYLDKEKVNEPEDSGICFRCWGSLKEAVGEFFEGANGSIVDGTFYRCQKCNLVGIIENKIMRFLDDNIRNK